MDRKIGKRIMFLSKHYQANINELLKDSDFTYAQFNILRVLKDHDGISQDVLCQQLMVDKARVSRVIQQLEEKQMIEKKCSLTDKRQCCIYMSEKGRINLPHITSILEKGSDQMLVGLEEKSVHTVLSILDHMCENAYKGGIHHE